MRITEKRMPNARAGLFFSFVVVRCCFQYTTQSPCWWRWWRWSWWFLRSAQFVTPTARNVRNIMLINAGHRDSHTRRAAFAHATSVPLRGCCCSALLPTRLLLLLWPFLASRPCALHPSLPSHISASFRSTFASDTGRHHHHHTRKHININAPAPTSASRQRVVCKPKHGTYIEARSQTEERSGAERTSRDH